MSIGLTAAGGRCATREPRSRGALPPLRGVSVAFAAVLLGFALQVFLVAVRAPLPGSRHFLRRRLHRRERFHHRPAGRLGRARCSARSIAVANAVVPQPKLTWLGAAVAPAAARVSGGRRDRVVRRQLHRQAERARARGAVHRPQHRRARERPSGSTRVAQSPVSGRHGPRGARSRQQPGDASEHPALGLARAAGHAAADPGDPHLLRFPRHRHRSLRNQRGRSDR